MKTIRKIAGVVVLSGVCVMASGAMASEGGLGAHFVDHTKTAPGVHAMNTQPPLEMFEPASTYEPPKKSVMFPAMAAGLGVLLAVISAVRGARC